jgi:hypothetical protein
MFKACDILHAKILKTGTFTEIKNFDIHFETLLPAQFGLPKSINNYMAEGVVIKPIEPIYHGNGMRVIAKHKAVASKETKNTSAKKTSPKFDQVRDAMISMITRNRYENVKGNNAQNTREYILVNAVLEDIIKDFSDEYSNLVEMYNLIPKKDKGQLKRLIRKEIKNMIHSKPEE